MEIAVTARNYNSKSVKYMEDLGYTVKVYENCTLMSEDELYECLKDADGAIVSVEAYTKHLLERLPNLKVISRRGIGYDAIDVEACKELGIAFTRTLGAVEAPVAEQVLAYMLYFARRVDLQSQILKSGIWNRSLKLGLKGNTLGLIGFGGIGKEIAKRALSFGMRVIATSHHDAIGTIVEGVEILSEDDVLAQSDFVSINVPLREDTFHYADKNFFKRMKKGAYFINIARGKVMDVDALVETLNIGHLAGCAVDVFDQEPCLDSPLAKFGDQVLITPHSCPMTYHDQYNMDQMAAENTVEVLDLIKGKK